MSAVAQDRGRRISPDLKNVEQGADVLLSLRGMAHLEFRIDEVVVAAPHAFAGDVPLLNEIGDDSLRRPFGNPDDEGDVTDAHVTVVGDRDQHSRVVGHERP